MELLCAVSRGLSAQPAWPPLPIPEGPLGTWFLWCSGGKSKILFIYVPFAFGSLLSSIPITFLPYRSCKGLKWNVTEVTETLPPKSPEELSEKRGTPVSADKSEEMEQTRPSGKTGVGHGEGRVGWEGVSTCGRQ